MSDIVFSEVWHFLKTYQLSYHEQKLFLLWKLKVASSTIMGKMKDSSLLKWTQNNKNNMLSGGKERKKTKEEKNKNWLHSPERLTSGHIAYLVKVTFAQTQWFWNIIKFDF